jgi:hypothetical protein
MGPWERRQIHDFPKKVTGNQEATPPMQMCMLHGAGIFCYCRTGANVESQSLALQIGYLLK